MGNELLLVILVSLMPVLEARAAFILAFINNIDSSVAFTIIFIFSSIPSVFLVYGLNTLENKFIRRNKLLEKIYSYVLGRIRRQISKVTRFKIIYLGLSVFVAIPLPGTGVWTGSILSYMFGFDKKLSVVSIIVGNLVSCMILYFTVYVLGSVVFRN